MLKSRRIAETLRLPFISEELGIFRAGKARKSYFSDSPSGVLSYLALAAFRAQNLIYRWIGEPRNLICDLELPDTDRRRSRAHLP
jgi:hypothetical protein